jgi:hypothetical protein
VGINQDAVTFGAQQVIDLAQQSDRRPLVTVDSHYSNPKWLHATVDAAFDTLGRLRPNRNLYRRPGPYSGRGTKQRKHGPPLKLKHAATWHDPDAWLCVPDAKLGRVEIMVWHDLHFRKAPDREVTVIRIHRLDARGTRRDPKDLWLMYDGEAPFDPVCDWRLYLRRFAIEHWYRFAKNDLLWVNFAGTDLHNTVLLQKTESVYPVSQLIRCYSRQSGKHGQPIQMAALRRRAHLTVCTLVFALCAELP